MIKTLHLATQYLAAAGISYLEKKEDDSHSNLGWSVEKQELSTRPLTAAGDRLAFNYSDFSLRWISSNKQTTSFKLAGKSHVEALIWIRQQYELKGITHPYQYDFHYELPYPFPGNDFEFDSFDQSAIIQHADL